MPRNSGSAVNVVLCRIFMTRKSEQKNEHVTQSIHWRGFIRTQSIPMDRGYVATLLFNAIVREKVILGSCLYPCLQIVSSSHT